jgi:predicted N-formylglutamate amidohydrolase
VALEAELDAITDADTDLLARAACGQVNKRPWMFVNRNSRLLVDPERFPDDREEMLEVGMGAVYLRTTDRRELRAPDPEDDARLMEKIYWSYTKALEALVQERLDRLGQVLIVDIHSFPREPLPYELHADQARPSLCIGTDPDHTPQSVIDAARSAWPGSVEINQPFSGCYVPERFYKKDDRVRSVMLEIRRDVMTDWVSRTPAERADSPIVDLVSAVIDSET